MDWVILKTTRWSQPTPQQNLSKLGQDAYHWFCPIIENNNIENKSKAQKLNFTLCSTKEVSKIFKSKYLMNRQFTKIKCWLISIHSSKNEISFLWFSMSENHLNNALRVSKTPIFCWKSTYYVKLLDTADSQSNKKSISSKCAVQIY